MRKLLLEEQSNVDHPGITLTIARKTFPTLKATAMRDVFEVLKNTGHYREENHNQTDHIYKHGKNELEFISLDQPQKVRGRKRHYAWLNEANEFTYEDFRQINMRTEKQIFIDYNPSDEFHWLYDHVLTRPDCKLIKSTFRDNPFLAPEIKREIELYQETDQNYWRIYGLGERGVSGATIYTHWDLVDELPTDGEHIFGLDYGFNHPTACTEVVLKDNEIYVDEKIYQSYLQNADRISLMKQLGIVDQLIYGDSENPEAIKEMQQAGLNVVPAHKGPGSVKAGIDKIKQRKFHITKRSTNILKEAKSYKWKTKGELVLDEPVKINDDAMDAIRMAVHSYLEQAFVGFV